MPARDPLPQPPRDDEPKPRPRGNFVLWIVAAGVALTGLVLFLSSQYPGALDDRLEQPRVVYLGIWAAVLGASLIVHWRERPGQMLRYVLIWIAIGAAIMVAYALFGRHFTG